MFECVGRILIASITFIRSTPLRSAKRLHSFRKREDRRSVAVLDDLRGLGFDRPFQDRQGIILRIDHFVQEFHDSSLGLRVNPAAYPPEVPDGPHIICPWHNSLVAMGQYGFRLNTRVRGRLS